MRTLLKPLRVRCYQSTLNSIKSFDWDVLRGVYNYFGEFSYFDNYWAEIRILLLMFWKLNSEKINRYLFRIFFNVFMMSRLLTLIVGSVYDLFKAKMHEISDSSPQYFMQNFFAQNNRVIFFQALCGLLGHNFSFFSRALFLLSRL